MKSECEYDIESPKNKATASKTEAQATTSKNNTEWPKNKATASKTEIPVTSTTSDIEENIKRTNLLELEYSKEQTVGDEQF